MGVSPPNPKQIKCMKKKLDKLNKKIIHSKREHNNLISKRNLIKNKIEELKGSREPEESFTPEESFSPVELSELLVGLIGIIELMGEVGWM